MNKTSIIIAASLLLLAGNVKSEETVKIGKQNVSITDGRMTPEALWAMGRIGSYAASPDGKNIVYQVGYYSVKANKSQQKLFVRPIIRMVRNHGITPALKYIVATTNRYQNFRFHRVSRVNI